MVGSAGSKYEIVSDEVPVKQNMSFLKPLIGFRMNDPFNLEESLLWVIAATKTRKPRTIAQEQRIVYESLERIYKKLEGKKIIVSFENDESKS